MKRFAAILAAVIIYSLFSTTVFADHSVQVLTEQLIQAVPGKVSVSYHSGTGKVRFLKTEAGQSIPQPTTLAANATPEDAAANFLSTYGPLFGISNPSQELKVKKQKKADRGRSFVRYQQVHNAVPVFGGELIVQLDASNNVESASGKVSPSPTIDVTPTIDQSAAKDKAIALVSELYNAASSSLTVTTPELWVYNPILLGHEYNKDFLVWRIEVRSNEGGDFDELVLVDAKMGIVALHFNQMPHAKNRVIFDNQNLWSQLNKLPGLGPVRTESSGPTWITDVDKAFTYAGYVYDFYNLYHGRNSIDNMGMSLYNTVRHCNQDPGGPVECPMQNAYWNGVQMVYGDGFASALDVVGHEMTHGVTQYEAALFYYAQSGAINESLSDTWGEIIQQIYEPPALANRWIMGENLPLGFQRSMSNPPLYGQPDRMSSSYYSCGTSDKGGVHTNSGVNNKAAFLMVDGGAFNGITVTGIGITKTIKIYYEAQTHLLFSSSDYADLHDILQAACSNLVGTSGITISDCQQVKNAVDAVEMNLPPTSCAMCPSGQLPIDLFRDNFDAGLGNWTHAFSIGGDGWSQKLLNTKDHYINGVDLSYASLSYIRMNNPVPIYSNTYMQFEHWYDFESDLFFNYDGGIVAYSTNSGGTWTNANALFSMNGYNGSIYSLGSNPLAGYAAFVGTANTYITSRLNLGTLAGLNAMFSFWVGTDSSNSGSWKGWNIYNVRIYQCSPGVPITVTTSPAGLNISVDGLIYIAPNSFTWPQGSGHSIIATTPQNGSVGTQYVFSSWSDGGTGNSRGITTPATTTTYTANYTTQYKLTTAVSPAGAGSVSPNCSSGCWYDSGTSPGLSASANPGYVFTSWTGDCSGTNSSTSVSMIAPKSCTANFALSSQITVTTVPAGRQISVDSVTYTAPQTFNWAIGSSHTINVATPQAGAPGTQYAFSSWNDAGIQSHSVIVPASPRTYIANFATQYQLLTSVAPAASGSVSPDCSAGCWYNGGAVISLTPIPAGVNTFSSWSGDMTSLNAPLTVTINAPKNITANFDTVPVTGTVRILLPPAAYYVAITDAYAAAVNNNIIEAQALTYGSPLTFNRIDIPGLTVTLKGGFNATFSDNTGYTTVGYPVILQTGTTIFDRITIQ